MTDHAVELVAAVLFAMALLHTFVAAQVDRLSTRFPRHAGLFHLLSEVEVVFGFWAIVLVLAIAFISGRDEALRYVETRHYTEPLFVFVVMVIAGSKPIVQAVTSAIDRVASLIPVRNSLAAAWLGLAAVPLLGSAITEPAAMTIAALMLAPRVFRPDVPERLKYFSIGVLFVNVSIGGTLSSFAAPPVLMVASTWGWDTAFMLQTFGWKAAVAVIVNATLAVAMLRNHLGEPSSTLPARARISVPSAVVAVHVAFLAAVVALSHHAVAFVGVFLVFLGFVQAYERHQNALVLREASLVACFLAGLVVLGGLQQWWLQPVVTSMSPGSLFLGATALTAIVDNAALTYLGSLITGMSDPARYSLVAGAVVGGGLTVIANAPNPAGAALLKRGFAGSRIGVFGLLSGALLPTLVAAMAFTWL